jgi:uncharacterized lipoprotein YehR (DUF1307 family)
MIIANKQIILMLVLVMVLFVSGCAGSKNILQVKSVVGKIVVVGNEPFTNLALQTSPSSILILDCSKETKDFLFNNQGKAVKIFYEMRDDTKTPNVIYVKNYEMLIQET